MQELEANQLADEECRICGAALKLLSEKMVMRQVSTLVKCKRCSVAFRLPMPDEARIEAHYNAKPYFRHAVSIEQKNAENQVAWLCRVLTDAEQDITSYDVVEFGSGDGWLLNSLAACGATVRGYEADADSVKRAKVQFGVETKSQFISIDDIAHLPCSSNTLFVMSHVFEHLREPDAFLKELGRCFPGSLCYLEVPDGLYEVPVMIKDNAPQSSLQEHLWSFSEDSLHKLCEINKFQILALEKVGHPSFYNYTHIILNLYEKLPWLSETNRHAFLPLSRLFFKTFFLLFEILKSFAKVRIGRIRHGKLDRSQLPSLRVLVRLGELQN